MCRRINLLLHPSHLFFFSNNAMEGVFQRNLTRNDLNRTAETDTHLNHDRN